MSRKDIPWLLATIKNAKEWDVPNIVKLLQDEIDQILKEEAGEGKNNETRQG